MEEELKEKVERIKEVYKEECGYYPTDVNIKEIIKMFTKGPTGFQAEIKRKLKQLEYNLKNPYIYKHWDSTVVPIFEDLEALAKGEMEFRGKWWGD